MPPHDPHLDDLSLAFLWKNYTEEEILNHLARYPKEKLEDLKPGDIWAELGDSVKAIKKRLLKDRPSLGEDGALEEARRLFREMRAQHGK